MISILGMVVFIPAILARLLLNLIDVRIHLIPVLAEWLTGVLDRELIVEKVSGLVMKGLRVHVLMGRED